MNFWTVKVCHEKLVLMQTQSRDGYVFVVLLFIHINVSVLTFLSEEMIFLRCKAIFLSSYEILEHKGHWNATVCAGFFMTSREKLWKLLSGAK